jgi:hypothetical protein
MSITWTEVADTRANLGPGAGLTQSNVAVFSVSDYPTGGYPINPQAFGMVRIIDLIPSGYTGAARGFVFEYDKTTQPTGNLVAYEQNGSTGALVQTASNTDFSASGGSLQLRAFGY